MCDFLLLGFVAPRLLLLLFLPGVAVAVAVARAVACGGGAAVVVLLGRLFLGSLRVTVSVAGLAGDSLGERLIMLQQQFLCYF